MAGKERRRLAGNLKRIKERLSGAFKYRKAKSAYAGSVQDTSRSNAMPTYVNRVLGYTALPRNGPVLPTCFTTHKYCQTKELASNAAGVALAPYFWNLNSLFDPDASVGGHQPFGFDQYAALYTIYTVYAVDVSLLFSGGASADAIGVWRCQHSNSGGAPFAGLLGTDFMEVPQGGGVILNSAAAAGNVTQVNLGRISIAAMEGLSKADIMADNTYQALVTASPLRVPQIGVGVCGTKGALVSTTFTIQLNYHVRWSGRVGLPGS